MSWIFPLTNDSNLEPGGYFEIQDYSYELLGNGGNKEFKTTYLYDWSVKMVGAAKISGRRIDVGPSLAAILRNTGFDVVTTEVRPLPIGDWPKDPKLGSIGGMLKQMFMGHLGGISYRLFTRHLKWTNAKTGVYLARVRKDLKEDRHFPLLTMYAPPDYEMTGTYLC